MTLKSLPLRRLNAVLFALCPFLYAACSLGNPTPLPTASATPAATPQATRPMLTYTNPAYGYSIDYPPDVTLQAERDEFVWLDGQISILVSSFNPEEARGDAPVIESAADTTVAGYDARRLSGYIGAVGGSTPQHYESVVFPRNNRFYVFTVYELKNDVALPPDRELGDIPQAARDLLEQIVSSVRFAD